MGRIDRGYGSAERAGIRYGDVGRAGERQGSAGKAGGGLTGERFRLVIKYISPIGPPPAFPLGCWLA